jgi:hypothetical protein
MASHITFVNSGLLLVIITIVVQSLPIQNDKKSINIYLIIDIIYFYILIVVQLPIKQPLEKSVNLIDTLSTTQTTTVSQNSIITTSEKKDQKKKRFINDDQLDGLLDSDEVDLPYDKIVHTLHPKIKETPVQIHDNADSTFNSNLVFLFVLFSRTS